MIEEEYKCHICGHELDESFGHNRHKVHFEYGCPNCGGFVKTRTYIAVHTWFSNGKNIKILEPKEGFKIIKKPSQDTNKENVK